MLPIQEDEAETNKDVEHDPEDDKLYQDEKTIPYAADTIRPDTTAPLAQDHLSLMQANEVHPVKES